MKARFPEAGLGIALEIGAKVNKGEMVGRQRRAPPRAPRGRRGVDRSRRLPVRGTYRGPDAVRAGVFARLGSEWEGYRAVPDAGDTIIVTGTYLGTYRATGRAMEAAFAHVWTLRAGKIVRFVQYVDSAKVREAM